MRRCIITFGLCLLLCGCSSRKELPSIPNDYRTISADSNIDISMYRPNAFYFDGELHTLVDLLHCKKTAAMLNSLDKEHTSEEYLGKITSQQVSTFRFSTDDSDVTIRCLYESGDVLERCDVTLKGTGFALVFPDLGVNIIYRAEDEVRLKFTRSAENDEI